MALHYIEIKWMHICCVLLSGSLFFSRGLLMLSGSRYVNSKVLARLSYVIDTALLAAAVLLAIIIRQYPFVQAWLTVKLVLLVLYVVLGVFALRRGATLWRRTGYFAAALAVYGFIISVDVTHDPRGAFGLAHLQGQDRHDGEQGHQALPPARIGATWVGEFSP